MYLARVVQSKVAAEKSQRDKGAKALLTYSARRAQTPSGKQN